METSRAPNNRREAFIRRRDSEIRENMAGERGEITELERLPRGNRVWVRFGFGSRRDVHAPFFFLFSSFFPFYYRPLVIDFIAERFNCSDCVFINNMIGAGIVDLSGHVYVISFEYLSAET